MASRREDLDLELRLRDPKRAREWIDEYNANRMKHLQSPVKYIVLNRFTADQRTIFFDRMNDEEAVYVARYMLMNWEVLDAVEQALASGAPH